jgi:hypothetical protein
MIFTLFDTQRDHHIGTGSNIASDSAVFLGWQHEHAVPLALIGRQKTLVNAVNQAGF